MHPGFFQWWRSRHVSASCGTANACSTNCGDSPGTWEERRDAAAGEGEGPFSGGGGPFGVRRPLRFMAHKLGLREDQVATLAGLLDELKTERAQADVDYRRSVGAFAESLSGVTFDAKRAAEAADARVKATDRVQKAVLKTLEKTHALLDDEQRKRLGYLLRTGVLTI